MNWVAGVLAVLLVIMVGMWLWERRKRVRLQWRIGRVRRVFAEELVGSRATGNMLQYNMLTGFLVNHLADEVRYIRDQERSILQVRSQSH
jgi:uncharacterized iron-regulated membrane protein